MVCVCMFILQNQTELSNWENREKKTQHFNKAREIKIKAKIHSEILLWSGIGQTVRCNKLGKIIVGAHRCTRTHNLSCFFFQSRQRHDEEMKKKIANEIIEWFQTSELCALFLEGKVQPLTSVWIVFANEYVNLCKFFARLKKIAHNNVTHAKKKEKKFVLHTILEMQMNV